VAGLQEAFQDIYSAYGLLVSGICRHKTVLVGKVLDQEYVGRVLDKFNNNLLINVIEE